MSALNAGFVADTLVWTGALLALVLVLRRPVAQLFGSRVAYALWLLPALRLVMPPIALPAWMAPADAPVFPGLATPGAAEAGLQVTSPSEVGAKAGAPAGFDTNAAPLDPAQPVAPMATADSWYSTIDWVSLGLAIWAVGAFAFLARRFWLYYEMRRDLLERAVPVGGEGDVRFVETPDVTGPVAFGLRDKCVALPKGFMSQRDRTARDMALAHEMAHHKGRDLLANVLVQPLFAAHWFNPLGLMGWRAMRRDQEAACDARVVAGRSRLEKACYASIIAEFATLNAGQPRQALAAPMACPVLGDKSVIQRLRSISMSDVSARRRMAGRFAVVAAALSLPMTASISYAAAEKDFGVQEGAFERAFADEGTSNKRVSNESRIEAAREHAEAAREHAEAVRAQAQAQSERAEDIREQAEAIREENDEMRKRVVFINTGHQHSANTDSAHTSVPQIRIVHRHKSVDQQDGADEANMKAMHLELEALGDDMGKLGIVISESVNSALADIDFDALDGKNVTVIEKCDKSGKGVTQTMSPDGKTKIVTICESRIEARAITGALTGLKAARARIAANMTLSKDVRAEVLQSLDEEIAELEQDIT